jgi:asparagine synthase (glutamine-hydrolysing)
MFFDPNRIPDLLPQAVYHAETPLKETYNVCSLMLSSMAKQKNIKVVLTGEGADELFAGYVGYRFDRQRPASPLLMDFDQLAERDIRARLWGDPDFLYEKELYAFNDIMRSVYSTELESTHSRFASTSHRILNVDRINGRDILHKRSYIDFKLRISDHLVADHGDRVGYANSIEARYPFLDVELIEFIATIPPALKLKDLTEKYILKQVSRKFLPAGICAREKFSFVAPGSYFLLKTNPDFTHDILSFERIKKQGYFNPDTVERLKRVYSSDKFQLNQTFETDLLMIILTFGILVDVFDLPNLN